MSIVGEVRPYLQPGTLDTSSGPRGLVGLVEQRSSAREKVSPPSIDARLEAAIWGLSKRSPRFAAAHGLWRWQSLTLLLAPIVIAVAAWLAPGASLTTGLLLLAMVFFSVTSLRLIAVFHLASRSYVSRVPQISDHSLPSYVVFVPLYQEADIVRDTIAAMARLDYPIDRYDVFLICEADDTETLAAIAAAPLPPQMHRIVVPVSEPRTKPKALNYALTLTSADLVVIYDAEDVPDIRQLRRAADGFAAADRSVACLQARLNIYNRNESWLTRQFTLEYSALFDGILPTLQQLRLPIPLGGTSNHFRRDALMAVGGWDAHNVTEDADLGIRLMRAGYRIRILASTTWEEAPAVWRPWLRQRTRWILGWLQTYGVHTREPWRLLREIGLWRFVGFQVLAAGLLLTAFLHPLLYITLAFELLRDAPFDPGVRHVDLAVWVVSGSNLVIGMWSALSIAAAAAAGRRFYDLLLSVAMMPLYWLLISYASYRALWQLIRQRQTPLRWEKTMHRARRPGECRR